MTAFSRWRLPINEGVNAGGSQDAKILGNNDDLSFERIQRFEQQVPLFIGAHQASRGLGSGTTHGRAIKRQFHDVVNSYAAKMVVNSSLRAAMAWPGDFAVHRHGFGSYRLWQDL
jgi:hypothetical protein